MLRKLFCSLLIPRSVFTSLPCLPTNLMRMIFVKLLLIILTGILNNNYSRPFCPSPTMSRTLNYRVVIHQGYTLDNNLAEKFIFELIVLTAVACLTFIRAFKLILNSTYYQPFSSETVKTEIHGSMDPDLLIYFYFLFF